MPQCQKKLTQEVGGDEEFSMLPMTKFGKLIQPVREVTFVVEDWKNLISPGFIIFVTFYYVLYKQYYTLKSL